MNEINVEDWKKNTEYDGYSKHDITIVYFWKVTYILFKKKK